jgi:hypothetical protein
MRLLGKSFIFVSVFLAIAGLAMTQPPGQKQDPPKKGKKGDPGVGKGKDPGVVTAATLPQSFEKLLPGMTNMQAQQDWQEICFRVGMPGNEELRLLACQLMAAKIGPEQPAATRLWLLRQLQYIGRAESVSAVAALLDDKEELIHEAAVRCLANNPAPEALAPLASKVQSASGRARVGLLNALGRRGANGGLPVLAKELSNTDPACAVAAARALAKISTPEAAKEIAAARGAAAGPLRLALNDAYLLYAEALLKAEKTDEAAAIYKALNKPEEPRMTRVAAFQGLVDTAGFEAGPLLVAALTGTDADVREIAIARISTLKPVALKAVAPALCQELLKIAQAAPPVGGQRPMAFKGLLYLIGLADDRPVQDKLNLHKQAMKIAELPDERKLLVEGLGAVSNAETLRYVVAFLDDKTVAPAACKAILELAASAPLREANQAEFSSALERVIALSNNKVQSDLAKFYKQGK